METAPDAKDGKCCTGGASNSCGCKTSGCKSIMAIVLLLIGGIVGYLMGSHCSGYKSMCPMSMAPMAGQSAPH